MGPWEPTSKKIREVSVATHPDPVEDNPKRRKKNPLYFLGL